MIKTEVVWVRTKHYMILVGASVLNVKKWAIMPILVQSQKFVLVSATSLSVTKTSKEDEVALEWLPGVYYLLQF